MEKLIIIDQEQSLDQWVLDTITPIIIVIDETMKQILIILIEFENGLN